MRGSQVPNMLLVAALALGLTVVPAECRGLEQPRPHDLPATGAAFEDFPGHIMQVEALSVTRTEGRSERSSTPSGRNLPVKGDPLHKPLAKQAEIEAAHQASERRGGPRLELPLRLESGSARRGQPTSQGRPTAWNVASSLTIVVGLFLILVWSLRRQLPQAPAALPTDAVRVLGRAPLAHRQTMQLVRIGNKLVLLCVTPQGAEALAEVTDPAEVERLAARCESAPKDSMSAAFRQVLAQLGDSPSSSEPTLEARPLGNPYSARVWS